MNILSIQSHVAYGHVGNDAAAFPLQRLGIEVWPVHTVQFSNHTGYGAWKGRVFDAGMIREVIAGIAERGVLRLLRRRALRLYGLGRYRRGHSRRGRAGAARQSGDALLLRSGDRRCRPRRVRAAGHPGIHARAGDAGGRRDHAQPVRAGLSVRGAKPKRSPTRFRPSSALHALGPSAILVTSLQTDETPGDSIDLLASDGNGRFLVRTPKLPISVNGAGDAIAALVLRALPAQRIDRAGAFGGGVLDLRRAQAHGRQAARAKSC